MGKYQSNVHGANARTIGEIVMRCLAITVLLFIVPTVTFAIEVPYETPAASWQDTFAVYTDSSYTSFSNTFDLYVSRSVTSKWDSSEMAT